MNSVLLDLLLISLLVGLNGFFVATEFALVSIRRSRVEELVAQGKIGARLVQKAVRSLDRYIAGTQVGITLASLALGWTGEPVVARMIEPLFHYLSLSESALHSVSFVAAFLFITFLHVVLGELVPKSLALQQPERTALVVSFPMAWIVVLLHPLIWSLNGTGNFILRMMGIKGSDGHHNVHSAEELQILVSQSYKAGALDGTESELIDRTFRFSELTAKEIMVRRVDVVGLDLEKPVEVLLDEAAASNNARLPAYHGTLDKLAGIVYVQDLFRASRQGKIEDLTSFCRPVSVIPESLHLDALLDFFRKHRTQIAIVLDEYGGTAGLVTFEDMVEEVTGDVEEQFEVEEPAIHSLPDGRISLRGDVRLDEVETALGYKLTEGEEDVETIAGLIMQRLGRIARVDDELRLGDLLLKVTDMARMRITRVSLTPLPAEKTK